MPTTEPEIISTNPAAYIDHTCLKADATESDFARLCEEAVEYGFASVCLPPNRVRFAAERLYGSGVEICTVIGFPLGYATASIKEQETVEAINSGATEIDMVIAIGDAVDGSLSSISEEIALVVKAAAPCPVKVIIECCYLTDPQKRALVSAIADAGAAYVKTSTGFGPAGATLTDVELLSNAAQGRLKVKAAGGIRTIGDLSTYVAAGADRIGTSNGVAIMQQWLTLQAD